MIVLLLCVHSYVTLPYVLCLCGFCYDLVHGMRANNTAGENVQH